MRRDPDDLAEAVTLRDGNTNAAMYCPTCTASFSAVVEICPHDGARLLAWHRQRDPLVGKILDGRFRVAGCLAVGSSSSVYRGVQLSVNRPVAIKVLREEVARDDVTARRFLREAHVLKRLNHPNIVTLIDFGYTSDGALYVVLELLRGRSLATELARGPLDIRRACALAIQISSGLAAAHQLGIVHRDLTPANIMLLDDPAMRDLVKIIDFGLARPQLADDAAQLTATGAILGTPRYVAPEAMFASGQVDPRSDLYTLGCVMYELFAGQPYVRLGHVLDSVQLPAKVPATLGDIVSALLAKAPHKRPPASLVGPRLQAWLDADLQDDAPSLSETDTLVAAPLVAVDRPTIRVVPPPTPVLPALPPTIAQMAPLLADAARSSPRIAPRGTDPPSLLEPVEVRPRLSLAWHPVVALAIIATLVVVIALLLLRSPV
jgi:serine/threonine protein kinase